MQNNQPSIAFEAINPQEIAKAAALFDNIKQLRVKLNSGNEALLERAFEMHVQGILSKLEAQLAQCHTAQEQAVEIILARHGLYDAAFQQTISFCQSVSPALSECIQDLRSNHSGLLVDLQHVCNEVIADNSRLVEDVNVRNNHIAELEDNCVRLDQTLRKLNEEANDQNQKILDLRQQLRSTSQELNRLREGYGASNTSSKKPTFDLNTSISNRPKSPGPNTVFSDSPRGTMKRSGSASSINMTASIRSETGSMKSSIALNTPVRGPLALVSPVNWLASFREDVQRALDDGKCRNMTLKECKDAIEKIYESKTVANEKAMQGIGNIPMETMEQHVYRNYEKKYGLRTLAVEHAGTLLKAVEEYAADDNEVCIFQCIFRNEVEEDFRLVQKELVQAIRDLAVVQLMGRFPTKDTVTINNFLEQKMSSGVIYEDEWRDMVNYLYNANDSSTLCLMLKKQAQLLRDKDNEVPALIATLQSPKTSNNSSFYTTNNSSSVGMMPPSSPVVLNKSLIQHKITGPVRVAVNNPNSPDSSTQDGNVKTALTASFVVGVPSVTRHSADKYGSGQISFDRTKSKDMKRLGYASSTLKIDVKDPNTRSRRDMLALPFPMFVKIIQDFQLRTHQEYLVNCREIFRQYDADVDGVLNAAEFREFYRSLRKVMSSTAGRYESEEDELRDFLSMIKLLDPHETDRVIFSSAVACLQQPTNQR